MPAKGTRRGTRRDDDDSRGRTAPWCGRVVFDAMEILVNGQPMVMPDGLTVEELLRALGVRREFTAVALNREVTVRSAYATTVLRDGDRVEIVRPMTGGR